MTKKPRNKRKENSKEERKDIEAMKERNEARTTERQKLRGSKTKKESKTDNKKTRERQRKRETQGKSNQKLGRKGDNQKFTKMPFLLVKKCFPSKTPQNKEKANKEQNKTIKKASGPSEVARRATSPDP